MRGVRAVYWREDHAEEIANGRISAALNAYRNSAEIRGLVEAAKSAEYKLDEFGLSDRQLPAYVCRGLVSDLRTALAAFKDSTPDKEKET